MRILCTSIPKKKEEIKKKKRIQYSLQNYNQLRIVDKIFFSDISCFFCFFFCLFFVFLLLFFFFFFFVVVVVFFFFLFCFLSVIDKYLGLQYCMQNVFFDCMYLL